MLVGTTFTHVVSRQKHLSALFETGNSSANAGAEYIGLAGSNPASWLAVKRCL